MRVAVVHEDFDGWPDAPLVERAVLGTVSAVSGALATLGHAPVDVAIDRDVAAWTGRLRDERPDAIFNLCESLGGDATAEPRVTGALELLGVPVTGASSDVLALAVRKDRVHAVLMAAGLPTPRSRVISSDADADAWDRFPAIVKPAADDASKGIEQASVAAGRAELRAALVRAADWAPLLVQEFLTGPELTVGIVGRCVLPVSQIDYSELPRGLWPLVTFAAKWDAASVEYAGTPVRCPAPIPSALRDQAVEIARSVWRLFGGRGFGRIDLRADDAGRLRVLDVNPNPDLAPDAGLARMAAAAGWSYEDLVGRILNEARA